MVEFFLPFGVFPPKVGPVVCGALYRVVFAGSSKVKASACNAGDLGSIPGSGRSPGEGNGNPLQYSCLENPMDGEAWWATVLSFCLFVFPLMGKAE